MARILVIDDDRDHCEFIVDALRSNGHDTTPLDPGLLLIRAIREPDFGAKFDLVITDIFMPDTDGIEVILALKMAHPRCKIIAISGGRRSGSSDYLHIAERLGAEVTLTKPFSIAELCAAVNRAIQMAQPPTGVGPLLPCHQHGHEQPMLGSPDDKANGGSEARRCLA